MMSVTFVGKNAYLIIRYFWPERMQNRDRIDKIRYQINILNENVI
jgi:hypothetical protein